MYIYIKIRASYFFLNVNLWNWLLFNTIWIPPSTFDPINMFTWKMLHLGLHVKLFLIGFFFYFQKSIIKLRHSFSISLPHGFDCGVWRKSLCVRNNFSSINILFYEVVLDLIILMYLFGLGLICKLVKKYIYVIYFIIIKKDKRYIFFLVWNYRD